eukprot:225293-Chlamydomonas_euryale.AAC.1
MLPAPTRSPKPTKTGSRTSSSSLPPALSTTICGSDSTLAGRLRHPLYRRSAMYTAGSPVSRATASGDATRRKSAMPVNAAAAKRASSSAASSEVSVGTSLRGAYAWCGEGGVEGKGLLRAHGVAREVWRGGACCGRIRAAWREGVESKGAQGLAAGAHVAWA